MNADKENSEAIELLVQKAQQGDEASFNALFDAWFDRVYRYTAYRVAQEDCEDIVGEIFLKVVEKLHLYKSRKDVGFGAWLFRLAHNTIIDWYRKKKELLGSEIGDEESDFFASMVDQERRPDEQTDSLYDYARVYKFLQKIKPEQREVLELKFLEGFSNKEISVITGKSEGNIRITQLRALKAMRKYLQEE